MEERRTVLVTGGARGIGRAIAAAFHARGDRLVITDMNGSALEETSTQLHCKGHLMDVTDWAQVHDTLKLVIDNSEGIDVLVNNAGIMSRHSVESTGESEWDKVLDTNLKGVFNCSHAVIPHMRQHRRGWIINIGSIWANHAWQNRAAYAASKAGVEQFTRCLALEVAPQGVLVNAISPGIMKSEMTKGVLEDPAFRAAFLPRLSLASVGDPEKHIAELALFLTTPAASYMTGEVIRVYGGYH